MQENRVNEGEDRTILSHSLSPIVVLIQWLIDLFYIPPIRKYISREQFRYVSCGGGNYIVLDTLLYYLIYHYVVAGRYINIGITTLSPHVAALAIVFPITFFTGFLLNRYVVFESTANKMKFQIVRYAITVVGSILLNYIIIKVLVEYVGLWATPSKVICSVITAIYSFFMARNFTFRGVK